MTEIEKKFSDITRLFASDGYEFLRVRARIDAFDKQAKDGDKNAAQLVDIFNKFHRLMLALK